MSGGQFPSDPPRLEGKHPLLTRGYQDATLMGLRGVQDYTANVAVAGLIGGCELGSGF